MQNVVKPDVSSHIHFEPTFRIERICRLQLLTNDSEEGQLA